MSDRLDAPTIQISGYVDDRPLAQRWPTASAWAITFVEDGSVRTVSWDDSRETRQAREYKP